MPKRVGILDGIVPGGATPEVTIAFMVANDRLLVKWSRKARKTGDDTLDGTPLGELWRTIRPRE